MENNEFYWKLSESEHHFNNIQAGIRSRASTWILAAFAAIAVLIQVSDEVSWLIPTSVLINIVSFMGTIGLVLLWINDQVVYQKLLGSVFMIGLKYEYDHPSLPPIRMMMYSSEGKGMSRWMTLYYTIPMVAFLAISIFVTLLPEESPGSSLLRPDQVFWVLLTICLAQGGIFIWVHSRKSKVSNRQLAENFGDPGFTSLFSKSEDVLPKYKEVIARHETKKTED